MTLSTPEELQRKYDLLTARITALDKEIAIETDSTRRAVSMSQRDSAAREREEIAAALTNIGRVAWDAKPIDVRLSFLEREVAHIWSHLKPGPRKVVSRIAFYSLLVALWSTWMIKETRDWLVDNEVQAVVITLALLLAAMIIRWLPEDDDDTAS